jgi:hypothetical protein
VLELAGAADNSWSVDVVQSLVDKSQCAPLRLKHGEVEGARSDIDAAHAHRQVGRVAAVVALADARICHGEGRHPEARAALSEARELIGPLHAGPEAPLRRHLTKVQALLGGAQG